MDNEQNTGIDEQEVVGVEEECDAIMLNTDLDDIPDTEPFEGGEKLITVISVKMVENEGKLPYLTFQLDLPEDEYAGHVFQNVVPPHASQKDGGVYCKQNWLAWMSFWGIERGPSGWMFKVAEGRSGWAIVKMSKPKDGFAPKPEVTRLLKPVE